MAGIRLKYCIEVPIFLMFFYFMVAAPVGTNFVIYRTCYVTLGYNQSDCAKLGTSNTDNATKELEQKVQPYANMITMTQSLLTQIIPAFMCLFIGPWSDKHGRKPVLVMSITGLTMASLLTLVVVLIPGLSPWYLLIGSVPIVLCGGVFPSIMAALCYITDITTETNRGMRIGIFDAIIAGGMLLGTATSSYIFAFGGYIMIYGLCILCNILTLLFIVFVLSESVHGTIEYEDEKFDIFSTTSIKEMFQTTFKSRESYGRPILLVLITISIIYVLASTSDFAIFYQFLREKFGWDMQQYTLYKSISGALAVIGTFCAIGILHKLLKISEGPLIFLGFLAYFASALIQGLATEDWHLYLAAAIRCICIISPMCRSLISKLVTQEETGKVFSVIVSLEALMNLIGSPLYTLIYNYTINSNPGIFNFVTAAMYGLEIILIITVLIMQKRMQSLPKYTALPINDGE